VHGALTNLAPAIAENGLSFVVFGTVAFAVVMSVLFLVTHGSDSMYDQIGQGGLSRDSDLPGDGAGSGSAPAGSPAARAEQEHEIRQMLEARSERRLRRGEAALDVDTELARLLGELDAPKPRDAGLVAEVRQMVVARNERRARQGMAPLDVDAEVARTLDELEP
jgi:hypothetical protein